MQGVKDTLKAIRILVVTLVLIVTRTLMVTFSSFLDDCYINAGTRYNRAAMGIMGTSGSASY